MTTISTYMGEDHRRCDALFAAAENAVAESAADNADWAAAKEKTEAFVEAMEQHFAMEEDILFPTFEQTTGMTQGPTQVMRHEHQQMRTLMEQLRCALDTSDQDEFLSVTETLLIMMQQHNMKEEGILYTMSDERLGGETAATVLEQMQKIASQ